GESVVQQSFSRLRLRLRLPTSQSLVPSPGHPPDMAAGNRHSRAVCAADSPDDVAHVVSYQQIPLHVQDHAGGAAHGFALFIHEAGKHVPRLAGGASVLEGNEDDLVAAQRLAVPGAVLADEHATAEELE